MGFNRTDVALTDPFPLIITAVHPHKHTQSGCHAQSVTGICLFIADEICASAFDVSLEHCYFVYAFAVGSERFTVCT